MRVGLVRALLVLALVLSCEWKTTGVRPDAAAGDAAPDADPGCHADCFGYSECVDGEVWEALHAPLPCDDPAYPYCPKWIAHVCEQGCAIEASVIYSAYVAEPSSLCAEAPAKMPGDECGFWTDCYPPPATVTEYGEIESALLVCDYVSHTCQPRPAPYMGNWLAPCPEAGTFVFTGLSGFVLDQASCWADVCVFADETAAGCVRQGCSYYCNHDEECPADAVCETGLTNHDPEPADDRWLGVCKPGPIGDFSGLECP